MAKPKVSGRNFYIHYNEQKKEAITLEGLREVVSSPFFCLRISYKLDNEGAWTPKKKGELLC